MKNHIPLGFHVVLLLFSGSVRNLIFFFVRLMASGGHAMCEDENEGRSVQKLEDWPDFLNEKDLSIQPTE